MDAARMAERGKPDAESASYGLRPRHGWMDRGRRLNGRSGYPSSGAGRSGHHSSRRRRRKIVIFRVLLAATGAVTIWILVMMSRYATRNPDGSLIPDILPDPRPLAPPPQVDGGTR